MVTSLDPLFIDLFPGDRQVDFRAFFAAGLPWCGAILKCSEGLHYRYDHWFQFQRRALLAAAGARYAVDAFDAAYHYLDLGADGAAQADYACSVVELAGGEMPGTLPLMVDVERGAQLPADCTRARVEDVTSKFAARYTALSGRTATLYGGELLRAVGVTSRLGCGRSAIALYGPTLPARTIVQTGTDLGHLMLWQYRGTDHIEHGPAGYPLEAPGCTAPVDISACVLPGGLAALRALLPR